MYNRLEVGTYQVLEGGISVPSGLLSARLSLFQSRVLVLLGHLGAASFPVP